MFAANASLFLSLAARILTKHIGCFFVSSKAKSKSEQEEAETEKSAGNTKTSHQFVEYAACVRKQSLKSPRLLASLYQSLLKALAIQMSNFVNVNSRTEVDSILHDMYVHLCSQAWVSGVDS